MGVPFISGVIKQKEAEAVQHTAQNTLENAQRSCSEEREAAMHELEKLGELKLSIYAEQIQDFVDAFKQIKNYQIVEGIGLKEAIDTLHMPETKLNEWKDRSIEAGSIIKNGVTGVGAGVLLGWGTYGAVATFGTASTGTAIATLSGAAATNATLAFLGGGAAYAGGGGVALGSTVLGGIVVIPALLVAGGLFNSSAKKKLNDAYSDLAEAQKASAELKTAETALKLIEDNACQLNYFLEKMRDILQQRNEELKTVIKKGCNWDSYTLDEKKTVRASVETVNIVKSVVDMPVLTEDGYLTKEIKNALNGGRETIRMLEGRTGDDAIDKIECPSCGTQLPGKAKFCNCCGARIF